MALPKLKVPKPPKVPKAPAWQTYKPARPNATPNLPKIATRGAPTGYERWGVGTPQPQWGQTAAKKPTVAKPMVPSYAPAPTQIPNFGYGQGAGLIGGDWEVQDAEAAMGSAMARARGDFQSGLRQALIDLGIGDTSKLGSLGQYIDQDTISKAVENKYSQTAQIGQQAERSRAVNNAALAARGILSSGQTTKSQSDVTAAAEQGRYSALRDFLSGGAQGLSGLGDLESQLAQGVAQARYSAAARAASMYPGAFGDEGQTDAYGNSLFTAPASAGLGNMPFWWDTLTPGRAAQIASVLKPANIRNMLGQTKWR